MLSLIVAMAEGSRVIGMGGSMPWVLTADLRRFKRITTGHTVVMGRRTWESIPSKFRPLPDRKNVVLSRQKQYLVPPGVGLVSSLSQALETQERIFVIGGESVFAEALPLAQRIYLTLVQYEKGGDTFFPADPWDGFESDPEVEESVPEDGKNTHASRFCVLTRRR